MKKIFILICAVATMVFIAMSCSNDDNITQKITPVKLNITVGNLDDDGTTRAAVKTGWAVNDQIKIWIDSRTDAKPNFVIKYNGSSWVADETAATTSVTPQSSGTLKCIYDGDVKVVSTGMPYTYADATLNASIYDWSFLTEIQLVVKGLTSTSVSTYRLACRNLTPCEGFTVSADCFTAVGTKGAATTGISNDDGVAFVFATADYTATSYKFSLFKPSWTKEYTSSKQIKENTGHKKIKNLVIDNSDNNKFTAAKHYYVNIDGLNWATMNLGADEIATSQDKCYGDYYAWAATEIWYGEKKWNSTDNSWTLTSWKTGYNDGYTTTTAPYSDASAFTKYTSSDSKSVLDNTDDAAVSKWGGDWRMPTQADFQTLYNACYNGAYDTATNPSGSNQTIGKGIYWCSGYDGVAGVLFCDGNSRLFFPAAGTCESKVSNNCGSFGLYWSSSLDTDDVSKACCLSFSSASLNISDNTSRGNGQSIRPVFD